MSDFTDLEYSVDSGEPFELYEFTRGVWSLYLTTRKTEFYVHDLQIYEPASITRGKIEHGEDPSRDQITITLPRNHDLVSEFINQRHGEKAAPGPGVCGCGRNLEGPGRFVRVEGRGSRFRVRIRLCHDAQVWAAIPLRADLPASSVWG